MTMKLNTPARYRRKMNAFGPLDAMHDESVVQFSDATSCYNFDISTGALRGGYGIDYSLDVPERARRYFVYRYYSTQAGRYVDQYIYQESSGLVLCYDEYTHERRYVHGQALAPINAINYKLNSKDVLLITAADSGMFVWDGNTLRECVGAPHITSMALHYERLFVTDRYDPTKVFFSDDLDPTNWEAGADGGGFIELPDERGELIKVESFANYLYIFREHGISRVTAFGDQNEFSVTNLFVTAGRIYKESIVKCGAGIMFLASDGLYRFDGYECAKVLPGLGRLLDGCKASAGAFFDGKYYLSLRVKFGDVRIVGSEGDLGYENNALLVYDISTGAYSVSRGLDIRFMNACTLSGKDFLMAADSAGGGIITRCGRRFFDSLPKHWQNPLSDFGTPDRVKMLREVYIETSADIVLGVTSKNTKFINVKQGDRRVRLNAVAKKFSLSIDTAAPDCVIRRPTLVYTSR